MIISCQILIIKVTEKKQIKLTFITQEEDTGNFFNIYTTELVTCYSPTPILFNLVITLCYSYK